MKIIYHIKDLIVRKSVLAEKKITYDDIVKKTGISRITLSRMASGSHNASADTIAKLCIYFDVTPEKFMTIIPDE